MCGGVILKFITEINKRESEITYPTLPLAEKITATYTSVFVSIKFGEKKFG